jgi:hypothetical protein
MDGIVEAAKQRQATTFAARVESESPLPESPADPDSQTPTEGSELIPVSIDDFEDAFAAEEEGSGDRDGTSPHLTIVASEKDPNQIELSFESETEDEPCAA